MAIDYVVKSKARGRITIGSQKKAAFFYALTVIICLVALVWVLKLRHDDFDISVPFVYQSDGLFNAMVIKGIIDNGWYLQNSFLGAPAGLSLLDFPMADNLHFLFIKTISFFTHNWAIVMNLFFLATFPLTALSSLFVFRRLKLSYPVASLGALIFSFLPYHFFRGEGHLFLSGIYVVPLACLAILRICSESPPLLRLNQEGKEIFDLRSLRTAGYLLVALLTASAGIYYAFFACFFLAVAGLYAAFNCKSLKRLLAAGLLIVLVGFGVLANIAPSLVFQHQNGPNNQVAQRPPAEAEKFGMKIAQLLLPASNHRISFLRDLSAEFEEKTKSRFVNENRSSSLGFIASFGFLLLLGWLALARNRFNNDKRFFRLLDALSVLNVFAVLLGIIGGFNILFAFFVSSQIRAYNRISIYIGFFSILGVLIVLEILRQKYARTNKHLIIYQCMVLLILTAGLFDQTNNQLIPPYIKLNQAYASDKDFVQQIENVLPENAMVFQLPYVPFPESWVNQMSAYDHFRGYLHSKTLRWSHGAVKGREGDQWQKEVAAKPTRLMLRELAQAGFQGVYLNRKGYADGAKKIEQELRDELRVAPRMNVDNSLLFFDMTDYIENLKSSQSQ